MIILIKFIKYYCTQYNGTYFQHSKLNKTLLIIHNVIRYILKVTKKLLNTYSKLCIKTIFCNKMKH